ncbi:olfactory receptor 10A4-like [Carettochelys insculpta]|uniref:olfactory receptor 10A4-like n=1 Tax=Carettochelys insculpta TaxID=44489 RepID=UPI003EB79381
MTYSGTDPGGNQTTSDVFILVGFSSLGKLQMLLFLVLLVIYLVTVLGNMFIILVIKFSPSLHTPMYFFLLNLSVLDFCYTNSVVPQLLVHLLVEEKTISVTGCAVQMVVITSTGVIDFCLLVAMAYDRYAAICHPLHYTTIMSNQLCARLAGALWFSVVSVKVAEVSWIFSLPFCVSNRIDNFLCDLPPVLKMACTNTSIEKILMLSKSLVFLISTFFLIILSYVRIIYTLLKLPSVEGRRKAFSTCSSHLILVSFFYGTVFFTYLVPKSSSTWESVLNMACTNTSIEKILLLSKSLVFLISTFFLIILSYVRIIYTILKMPSVEGRRKAFSTCSSHLILGPDVF